MIAAIALFAAAAVAFAWIRTRRKRKTGAVHQRAA
jgi:hypothetical protein